MGSFGQNPAVGSFGQNRRPVVLSIDPGAPELVIVNGNNCRMPRFVSYLRYVVNWQIRKELTTSAANQ
jgi:hypothetical protein